MGLQAAFHDPVIGTLTGSFADTDAEVPGLLCVHEEHACRIYP
jgi:hypothetical protein